MWFLDGHPFESMYDDFDDRGLIVAAKRKIEAKYTGLIPLINAELKAQIRWNDRIPYARPALRALADKTQEGYMVASGRLLPLNIGNTGFEDAAPQLEPFIVMERGRVCTQEEYERIQQEQYGA